MKVPQWAVPALVLVFAVLGVGGARLLVFPSVVKEFGAGAGRGLPTVVMVVNGVKCVDTAERAAGQFAAIPGVVRFVAYASRNRVEVTFDPTKTTPLKLREALEGPVYDEASGETLFGVFKVLELNGRDVTLN